MDCVVFYYCLDVFMCFVLLGSGSKGNVLLVEVGCIWVLIDCGFGLCNLV